MCDGKVKILDPFSLMAYFLCLKRPRNVTSNLVGEVEVFSLHEICQSKELSYKGNNLVASTNF